MNELPVITGYGLLDARTNELMGLRCEGIGGDGEFSGGYESFIEGRDFPIYIVPEMTDAKTALSQDTPWYNSGHRMPQISESLRPHLKVVRLTVTVESVE